MSRRILVVTVVHHPQDARILHRQIAALLGAGWQVTYAAPWGDYAAPRPDLLGLTTLDVARASGRHRLAAQLSVRHLLKSTAAAHDVVLLHDPELVLTTVGLSLPPVVWDVHEDTAAAVEVRSWLPDLLRAPVAAAVRAGERWAEVHRFLLLADEQYAGRFRHEHPVVPNTTFVVAEPVPAGVPDEHGTLRVVYLGSVTMERGALELVEVGRSLRRATGGGVRLDVLGPAHGPAEGLMRSAHADGSLEWSGFIPNNEAMARLDGALAGLSLLHDESNFRPSMPTKVVEYMAHGIPVITTPLPVPAKLVSSSGGGVIVPFGDPEAVVQQLLAWVSDPAVAVEVGRLGHGAARDHLDWNRHAATFVEALEQVVAQGPSRRF